MPRCAVISYHEYVRKSLSLNFKLITALSILDLVRSKTRDLVIFHDFFFRKILFFFSPRLMVFQRSIWWALLLRSSLQTLFFRLSGKAILFWPLGLRPIILPHIISLSNPSCRRTWPAPFFCHGGSGWNALVFFHLQQASSLLLRFVSQIFFILRQKHISKLSRRQIAAFLRLHASASCNRTYNFMCLVNTVFAIVALMWVPQWPY